MKWFNKLRIKSKDSFLRSNSKQESTSLKKGRDLYLSCKFNEALFHFDHSINSGFDIKILKLRARCLQKLNKHFLAIEDFDKLIEENPLEFSNYYRRAVSKNALFDLKGQIEDLQNCIYYYRKSKNAQSLILKNLEIDLITTGNYVEEVKNNIISIHNISYLEIKNLISECLIQIKRIRLQSRRFKSPAKGKIATKLILP
ncbi:hypothetical protein LPB248_00655 [Flavobacterium sp. LPB0248]|uniref:hypothetical protein n=1 Tax=Flavobacterium sp. LPB0248 TaxID=2614441 RepID=UPI0015A5A2B7|nr:hypothetical protein [Flavobacterium sp. LPB0248]QLC64839.1 hypothetical protein LPB248_00655 [Flavobacterium sp. LPB0248]